MASEYDFSIDQGATKRLSLVYRSQTGTDSSGNPTYTAYDLTGCSARMQIRQSVGAAVLAEMSTTNGNIVLQTGGALGQVDVVMTPAETNALTVRRAVYDIELTWPSGDVVRLIQGKITVSLAVTE